jgi:hypothetical protein
LFSFVGNGRMGGVPAKGNLRLSPCSMRSSSDRSRDVTPNASAAVT